MKTIELKSPEWLTTLIEKSDIEPDKIAELFINLAQPKLDEWEIKRDLNSELAKLTNVSDCITECKETENVTWGDDDGSGRQSQEIENTVYVNGKIIGVGSVTGVIDGRWDQPEIDVDFDVDGITFQDLIKLGGHFKENAEDIIEEMEENPDEPEVFDDPYYTIPGVIERSLHSILER